MQSHKYFCPITLNAPNSSSKLWGAIIIENLAKKGQKDRQNNATQFQTCVVLHSRLIIYEEGKLLNVVQRRIDVNDSVTILALDCYIKSSHLVSKNALFASCIGTAERTTITIHRTKHIRPGYHEYNQKGK